MGTGIAYYVRTDEPAKLKPFLQGFLWRKERVDHEPPIPFVRVERDDAVAPVERLAEVSRKLSTDVLWIAFQSVVDAFQYLHWRDGELVRALTYGFEEERVWERAEGASEPWEAAVFGATPPVPGEVEPAIDARETARAIALHYRLAGWDLPR